ncbi:MAG: hypothetical protein HN350_03620 [Phycisphaerales bacterium]|jgi:hypothetical protein|nr:hypothetical protein [Phycisphaerales bacterium]
MKNCLLILVAGVILCVPFGCNRDADTDPVAYDRDVDGPPVAIIPDVPDYDIIGEPSVVAKRRLALQEAAGSAADNGDTPVATGDADPTGPEGDLSDDELTAARELVLKIRLANEEGDIEAGLACLSEKTSTTLKGLITSTGDIQAKVAELDAQMQTTFDAAYPDQTKESLNNLPELIKPVATLEGIFGTFTDDQLSFTKIGEQLIATAPQKIKLIYTKGDDDEWKIAFGQDMQAIMTIAAEYIIAVDSLATTLTAGVKDGTITAQGVQAKTDELIELNITPVKNKLIEAQGGAVDDDTADPDADSSAI